MAAGDALMGAAGKGSKPAAGPSGTRNDFIKKAIRHVGSLHRALGVPTDQTIPAAKMAAAAASGSPDVKKKVELAKVLESLPHK